MLVGAGWLQILAEAERLLCSRLRQVGLMPPRGIYSRKVRGRPGCVCGGQGRILAGDNRAHLDQRQGSFSVDLKED